MPINSVEFSSGAVGTTRAGAAPALAVRLGSVLWLAGQVVHERIGARRPKSGGQIPAGYRWVSRDWTGRDAAIRVVLPELIVVEREDAVGMRHDIPKVASPIKGRRRRAGLIPDRIQTRVQVADRALIGPKLIRQRDHARELRRRGTGAAEDPPAASRVSAVKARVGRNPGQDAAVDGRIPGQVGDAARVLANHRCLRGLPGGSGVDGARVAAGRDRGPGLVPDRLRRVGGWRPGEVSRVRAAGVEGNVARRGPNPPAL